SSPCRGAGSLTVLPFSGRQRDIDGEVWAHPPSIGCDEFQATPTAGPLTALLSADYTNVAVGFPVNFSASILGRATANRFEDGTGAVINNQTCQPFFQAAWNAPGDYLVTFTAYNDDFPAGMSATVTVHVISQPIHYVALISTNPLAPYFTWQTAATNIN